jgi:hypothetical protein
MWLTQGSGTRIARRGGTKTISFRECSVNGYGGDINCSGYKRYASLGVERSTPCGISAWPRHVGLQQGLKYRVMIDSKNSSSRRKSGARQGSLRNSRGPVSVESSRDRRTARLDTEDLQQCDQRAPVGPPRATARVNPKVQTHLALRPSRGCRIERRAQKL